jgi:hypothetical protein
VNSQPQNSIISEISQDAELREQLKKLVLERVGAMPDSMNLAVGAAELTKDTLLEHIRQEDEIGKQFMEMDLEFLRDLASGAIYAGK